MPRCIQRKGAAYRHVRGNFGQLVSPCFRVCVRIGCENKRIPSVLGQMSCEIQGALESTAPATRWIMKSDHEYAFAQGMLQFASRQSLSLTTSVAAEFLTSPAVSPRAVTSTCVVPSTQISGGAGWLRNPRGLADLP